MASPSAGSDAGSILATRLTSTARWLMPKAPDERPPAIVRAACAGGAKRTGSRSGTIASSGSSPIASMTAADFAVHASRGDQSIIHRPSGPDATIARACRIASLRWRASTGTTNSGARRRPLWMTARIHSSSRTGQSATIRRHVAVAAGGVTGRGSSSGAASIRALAPGSNPARLTTAQPATCCSRRCDAVGCGSSAAKSASPPERAAGGSRRSVPSRATVTISRQ